MNVISPVTWLHTCLTLNVLSQTFLHEIITKKFSYLKTHDDFTILPETGASPEEACSLSCFLNTTPIWKKAAILVLQNRSLLSFLLQYLTNAWLHRSIQPAAPAESRLLGSLPSSCRHCEKVSVKAQKGVVGDGRGAGTGLGPITEISEHFLLQGWCTASPSSL